MRSVPLKFSSFLGQPLYCCTGKRIFPKQLVHAQVPPLKSPFALDDPIPHKYQYSQNKLVWCQPKPTNPFQYPVGILLVTSTSDS